MWQLQNAFQSSEQYNELIQRCSSSSGVFNETLAFPTEWKKSTLQSGILYDAKQLHCAGREDAGLCTLTASVLACSAYTSVVALEESAKAGLPRQSELHAAGEDPRTISCTSMLHVRRSTKGPLIQ